MKSICTPPKPLALADALEKSSYRTEREAAAELRSLHEEVEELRYDREDLRKIAEVLEAQERFLGSWHSIVRQAFARIDSDEALLRQALDALDPPEHLRFGGTTRRKVAAIAALQDRLK